MKTETLLDNDFTNDTITITTPDTGTAVGTYWLYPLPSGGSCPECGYCRSCGRYLGPAFPRTPYCVTWSNGAIHYY